MASQLRLDQIRDLVNQWEQLTGYRTAVPDWAVSEMAEVPLDGRQVSTLYDIGQYMFAHWNVRGDDPGAYFVGWLEQMPWAQYGMSSIQYDKKLEQFDSVFRGLTGQAAPQDLVGQALHEHQGAMEGREFETWLLAQDSIKNTYGWLRYGLDFNQFQEQKLRMRTSFGRELSDQEAVTQLQYHHAAQGPQVAVTTRQEQGQQQRRQAEVGISGSVVR